MLYLPVEGQPIHRIDNSWLEYEFSLTKRRNARRAQQQLQKFEEELLRNFACDWNNSFTKEEKIQFAKAIYDYFLLLGVYISNEPTLYQEA